MWGTTSLSLDFSACVRLTRRAYAAGRANLAPPRSRGKAVARGVLAPLGGVAQPEAGRTPGGGGLLAVTAEHFTRFSRTDSQLLADLLLGPNARLRVR